MSQDLTQAQPSNPFSKMPIAASHHANVGAISIEQERAIAEAQGQLTLAKRFPRDMNSAYAELMEACASPAFASSAFYSVPNRGSGPSIRFAEEVARVYGNFIYGHRELSRSEGKSEIEVFAWDMEKNNRSTRQLTVMHVVDTKYGPKPCRDQSDIDNLIANKASKQIRGRILALLPKWLVAEAIEKCKQTIAGTGDEPIPVRVRKMINAFSKYGVNTDHLERYIGHTLDDVTLDELIDLTGVFNAIREGAKPSEYFASDEPQPDEKKAAVNAAIAGGAANQNAPAEQKQDQQQPAERQQRPTQQRTSAPRASQKQQDNTPEQAQEQQHQDAGQQQSDQHTEPAQAAGPLF